MWEKHENFKEVLDDSWNKEHKACTLQDLQQKLKDVSSQLIHWNRATFGHVQSELRKLKKDLERRFCGVNNPELCG